MSHNVAARHDAIRLSDQGLGVTAPGWAEGSRRAPLLARQGAEIALARGDHGAGVGQILLHVGGLHVAIDGGLVGVDLVEAL